MSEETSAISGRSQRKRGYRSLVWKDFERLETEDGSIWAICKACDGRFNGDSKHGTSHLLKHLQHCKDYKKLKGKTSCMNQEGSGSNEGHRFDQNVSRNDLARMIILHGYPFSMVQHEGFRTFVHNLRPEFNMVSRTTVKGDSMKIFENEKQKLFGILSKLQCRVSMTMDMWTSGQNISYMSLTVHYVDESWTLQKRILNFCKVSERPKGVALAKIVERKLCEWNIEKKIFSIVLDNCSTNDVVVRELNNILNSKRALLSNGELFHVRCWAHVLNLIVQDGLIPISNIIEKVRESVKWVKASPQRLVTFEECITQIGGPSNALVLDCPTRWNSTFLMLETALKFKDIFSCLSMFHESYKDCPSIDEWERVVLVQDCLKPFYDVTEVFSHTLCPTANVYFGMVCELYLCVKEWCMSQYDFISSMAFNMLRKFEKYWEITSMILSIACILDPRQKMKPIELYFPLVYDELEANNKIATVERTLKKMFEEYERRMPHLPSDKNDLESRNIGFLSTSSASNLTSLRSSWASKLKRLDKYLEETSMNHPSKSDLELYLDEPVVPSKHGVFGDFDLLSWWKDNAAKYPTLACMARDILGIPISTVASEAAFSTGGRIIDQTRTRLHPKTVEGLICAQDWIRNELRDLSIDELAVSDDESSNITRDFLEDVEYILD